MPESQSSQSHALPEQLGRYELVRLLGEDSVARMFLARPLARTEGSGWVALKRAHQHLANDATFRRAFRVQARIGLGLKHPNVVRTHEVVAEPGQCYCVTELLRGQVLSRLLDAVQLDLELKVGILLQVLAGLSYVHEYGRSRGKWLGLVHRDLTPARVFVGYDGRVRLLDCGLSRVAAAASVRRDNPDMVMRYSAPEQCLGKPVDARTDVYAVGVMLWEAMVGLPRQFGGSLAEMLEARVNNREPSIERVWPEAPPYLAFICRRALAFEPEGRYATAFELGRALNHYVQTTRRDVGQAALRNVLVAQSAQDVQDFEQLLQAPVPAPRASEPPRASKPPRLPEPLRVSEPPPLPSSAPPEPRLSQPPPLPSSVPPELRDSRVSWAPAPAPAPEVALNASGPSTHPVMLPALAHVQSTPAALRFGPKLVLGACGGALLGVLIGVAVQMGQPSRPGEILRVAAALPTASEAASEVASAPGPPAPAEQAPASSPSILPSTPRFVVRAVEPPPELGADGRFVVKRYSALALDRRAGRATENNRDGTAAKSKRRQRPEERVPGASQQRTDSERTPRPIDDTDPYPDRALVGREGQAP